MARETSATRQTELHRHLDVSVRLSTLHELAIEKLLIPQSTSLESFGEKILLRSPLTDLRAVLEAFEFFPTVLSRPEDLERISRECIEDCYAEGTRRVELRYSPAFLSSHSGLDWTLALDAIERGITQGLARCPGMEAGLICIISREFGLDQAQKTLEFLLQNRHRFMALDLAGHDALDSNKELAPMFKQAREAGIFITVHAGESTGPESIWSAIEELGAQRIGHGIRCVDDPRLMDYLAQNQICLEVCPSSNWLTRCVPSLDRHPLPQIVRAGIPASINTDDPGVFPVTLTSEIDLCRRVMGMSAAEIAGCLKTADEATFLNTRY